MIVLCCVYSMEGGDYTVTCTGKNLTYIIKNVIIFLNETIAFTYIIVKKKLRKTFPKPCY